MRSLSENLWLLSLPLKILGVDIRRNVTLIRLSSGKLIIHSTAHFSEKDTAAIRSSGEPGWLVEAMVDHDTFSSEGHAAFPEVPFFAPEKFGERVEFPVCSLQEPPPEWLPEIEVIQVRGIPKMDEYVFFHHPSGTLVVCDLLFNFPEISSLWAKLLLTPTLGLNPSPGFSKRVRMAIKDREEFSESLRQILALPIRRIVPGHGEVLEHDAKERARAVFEKSGFV